MTGVSGFWSVSGYYFYERYRVECCPRQQLCRRLAFGQNVAAQVQPLVACGCIGNDRHRLVLLVQRCLAVKGNRDLPVLARRNRCACPFGDGTATGRLYRIDNQRIFARIFESKRMNYFFALYHIAEVVPAVGKRKCRLTAHHRRIGNHDRTYGMCRPYRFFIRCLGSVFGRSFPPVGDFALWLGFWLALLRLCRECKQQHTQQCQNQ